MNLRVIRETVHCTLPIEVMIYDPKQRSVESPTISMLLPHLHARFPDVRFVDLRANVRGLPPGFLLSGYYVKLIAMAVCSFEEILALDTDNIPVIDPSFVFDLGVYQQFGTVFWPDICGYTTAAQTMWEVFGMTAPDYYPVTKSDYLWLKISKCEPNHPREIQGGEVLLNKRRGWKGLWMTLFINYHYTAFFHKHIFGEKMSYSFGFDFTSTPFTIVDVPFFILGHADNASSFICGNTFGQRHPETGELCWLHRHGAKFVDRDSFKLDTATPARAWKHMSKVAPFIDHWATSFNSWQSRTADIGMAEQFSCLIPDPAYEIRPVENKACPSLHFIMFRS